MMNVAHFTSGDVQHLFEDKHVVVIGDSGRCCFYVLFNVHWFAKYIML